MSTKTQHLQIRVSPGEKETLRRRAAAAGLDLSSYVLACALPPARQRVEELLSILAHAPAHRHVLAELNDLLTWLSAGEFRRAVEHADVSPLPPMLANYVAAMVEQGAAAKAVEPPAWLRRVPPLAEPYFTTSLAALRLHLLRASPVPFKRRNLFIDSSLGARV